MKITKKIDGTKNRRKQRKSRFTTPLHLKNKLMGCHLSKELRKKYEQRSITLRKGDTVKILRGQFRGKTGKVEEVDTKKGRVAVKGIEVIKKDGNKSYFKINVSNLMIMEAVTEDKRRFREAKKK